MIPHFDVNSLILLPAWDSDWVGKKKVQTLFYIPVPVPCGVQLDTIFTDSFVCRSFPNFKPVQQIFSRNLFPQFLFTIFCTFVLVQISDVSQERNVGSHASYQIQTRMFTKASIGLWRGVPTTARWRVQEPTYTKYSATVCLILIDHP